MDFQAPKMYDSRTLQSLNYELKQLWHSKSSIVSLAIFELNARYRKTVLGVIWAILNPLLTASVIFFIFGGIFNGYLPGERGYFFWVYSGLVLQLFIMQGMVTAVNGLIVKLPLIKNYRLSPISISLIVGLALTLNFLIGSLSLIPAAFISGLDVSYRILLLPLFCVFTTLFLSGMGMILVYWFQRFDDVSQIFGIATMIVAYLSPFLYPFEILREPLRTLVSANPFTSFILVFRWMVLSEQYINPMRLVIVPVFSALIFFLGIRYLRRKWTEVVML